ncbi:putative periplasmic ligand-binding sensor domain protein [Bernardetia litoralis DSM 6794]|uniref:Putative periplasmic ligand-binding sensor domain protein n=1 Tax=Bernardetia litoralis (strain ATCC 23117 / DSM 6794 / NBRC 15988 / NCIMB 1366 / Fx l1 / Sio-4) TaxID=880071 RepID=I4AHQ3_BERLS|nr:two-component regulator propeller domain-containing protein [Bernardetia litoralis]AFM03488.1 putative periplasmic ligand-binding sensor domain protein [Bernardetia litoralis DSM 6794]
MSCFFVQGRFSSLYAQSNMSFEHITIDDGLSQNTPNVFFQDSRGLLWIGTQDGLNMYDGIKFHHYKRVVDNINSISDNLILCITEDKEGNIWVGTEGGLNMFDFSKQHFTRYRNNPADENSIINNTVRSIHCDKNGEIWAGTDGGLVHFLQDSKTFETFKEQKRDESIVRCFLEDKNGILWVGTNAGLAAFDRKINQFEKRGFRRDAINGMVMDNEGNIWAGGARGLFKRTFLTSNYMDVTQNRYLTINNLFIDDKGLLWLMTDDGLQYLKPWYSSPRLRVIRSRNTDPSSLSSNDILTMFEDQAGIIWIGTNGYGINKFDRNRIKFDTYTAARTGLSDNTVRSVLEDKHGILWIGTIQGLNKYKEGIEQASVIGMLSKKKIYAIYEDNQNQVWVGTMENGIYIFDNSKPSLGVIFKKRLTTRTTKGLLSNSIRVIYQDKAGTIWIGTDKGGLSRYNASTNSFKTFANDPNVLNSLSNNRVRGIYEDLEGTLWVSTYGGGLNKFDEKDESFSVYKSDVNDKYSISTNRIYPVYEDDRSHFWVLTYGGGLNLLDRKTGKFKHFTEEDGLPNNVLYGVLEDSKKNLWFSTNRGISKFTPSDTAFVNFGVEDGLQANEFNSGAYAKGKTGMMYFGGINGLNYFHPDSIQGNSYIAPVLFTNFQVNNKNIEIGDSSIIQKHISLVEKIQLNHKQNSFAFFFASLHYSFPERNKYQYKLEGFDTDWIESNRGEAQYTNLDAGEYTFLVKGSNSDGVWNEEPISVKIVITDAWYNALEAKVAFALIVLLTLFLIYRWRIWRVEQKRKQLEQKIALRTKELTQEKEKVEQQNTLIESANKKITDSIRYAQRIQDAIIPSEEEMLDAFTEHFVLFQPRDIVSGDFYWSWKNNGLSHFAVVDCTGHGVPGAIMSVVGFAMLEQTTKVKQINEPAKILTEMNTGIVGWLKQNEGNVLHETGKIWKSRDGMDMSMISLDKVNRKIVFSGAKNSLFHTENGKIIEVKGDRFSIGGTLLKQKQKTFTDKHISLQKNDMVYLTTDGFLDQFGGGNNKKYSKKRFIELLNKIQHLPLKEQQKKLQESFVHWQGLQRQIDDMLVIGIRM